MRTCLRLFLFLSLALPMLTYAQADIPAPDSETVHEISCGVDMGRVIPADGSICREDIAFGMLYEMFPSLFDTLLPFWGLTAFNDISDQPEIPDLKGEYYGNDVFFVLFNLFYKMVLYCIGLYLFVIALSLLLRLIRGDSITEKTPMKDNVKSWMLGAGIGGSFLIPVKSFFVGQIVVFTLGVGALSMANFAYSVVLSGNQTLFGEGLNPTRVTDEVTPDGTMNRHKYLADHYFKYLVRMHICRDESSSYQLGGILTSLGSPEQVESFYTCSKGVDDPVFSEGWGVTTPGPFIWSTLNDSGRRINESYLKKDTSKLSFEARPSSSLECHLYGNGALDYKCGSLSIHNPDWSSNPLVELLDDPRVLFDALDELSKNIHPSMPPESAFLVVSAAWENLDKVLREALVEAWRENKSITDEDVFVSVNNEVMRKRDALRAALMHDNRPLFMQASRMFHQSAMNVLMFGAHSEYKQVRDQDWTKMSDSKILFKYHWDNTADIASLVREVQCVSNHGGLLESNLLLKYQNGELENMPQEASARCLDMERGEVKGYNPEWDRMSDQELAEIIDDRRDDLQGRINDRWASMVNLLAEQRASIERSFAESMRNAERQSWWSRLRKQGYLSAGDYAQIMNSEINGYKRQVKLIVNNFSTDGMFYTPEYISEDLITLFTIDGNYPEFMFGELALLGTREEYSRVDPLVDSYHWVTSQEAMLRQESLNLQSFELSDLLAAWNTGGTYLDRLGIDLYQEGKSESACLEDPKYCPFPLTDPIVELSLMGHDMLDMAIQFYAVAIPLKALKQRPKGSANDGSIGGVVNKISVQLQDSRMLGGVAGMLTRTANGLGHMVDFIYSMLSGVMGMFMALGAALAYLLPLVPKIYLYMGFVSWLMVLVMSSFSVLLLALFWVRYNEKRDLVKTAILHHGVELAFKPTFNLLAMFFAAYFFYVVAFIVGGTMNYIWNLTATEPSFVMGYVQTIFILMVIAFVYILGLRYVYQLMDDLAGEILSRLGVQNKKVKDQVSDVIKSIVFDAGQRKSSQLHDKMGNVGKKDPRAMEQRLATAGREVAEARQALAAKRSLS